MAFRLSGPPIELHDPADIFDRTAAKVFLNLEEMLNHPVGTYMARLGADARATTEINLLRVREILTDKQIPLKEFPWWKLEYRNLRALRIVLNQRFTPHRVNIALSAVRGVLKECWRMGLMTHANYFRAASIEGIRESRHIRGRYIRPPELKRLFDFCFADFRPQGARDAAIFAVLYCTGLRTTELVNLDVQDYEQDTGEIVVRKGKNARPRRAFIKNEGRAALSSWMKIRGTDPGPLFVGIYRSGFMFRRRITRGHLSHVVRSRARDAGIGKVRPHDLRRSFISNLLDLGVDLFTVSKMAGHVSLHATALYDYRGRIAMKGAAERIKIPYRGGAWRHRREVTKPINVKAERQAFALSSLRLGKYAWQILDALQKHRRITPTIPSEVARASLGDAVRRLPQGLIHRPSKLGPTPGKQERQAYFRAQNRVVQTHKSFATLEKYGLIASEGAKIETGRHAPYAGYRITRLGRVTYQVACAAGLHHNRIELIQIREELALALEKRGR